MGLPIRESTTEAEAEAEIDGATETVPPKVPLMASQSSVSDLTDEAEDTVVEKPVSLELPVRDRFNGTLPPKFLCRDDIHRARLDSDS